MIALLMVLFFAALVVAVYCSALGNRRGSAAGVLAAVVLLGAALVTGCTKVNIGGPSQISNQVTGGGGGPGTVTTPTPSPGATGSVASCSFGPFGWSGPGTKPPNSQRPYPLCMSCEAITTVTPRTAPPDNDPIFDVRLSGRFPEFRVIDGGDVLAVEVNLGSNSDGYNADLVPLKVGRAKARATVRPPGGAPVSCELDVQVVP